MAVKGFVRTVGNKHLLLHQASSQRAADPPPSTRQPVNSNISVGIFQERLKGYPSFPEF